MIHPTAIIDSKAEVAPDVEVGAYCVIEANVKIASGSSLGPYVHVQGRTEIGPNNIIGTGAMLGLPPQHIQYQGAPTRLIIGARNTIREGVSIHRAFKEEEATVIGDDCFLMGFCHVAHDCHIGNRVIIANGVLLAGHVAVDDRAFISGGVVIHQFCRIGRLCMVSGQTGVGQDTPPFMIVEGRPVSVRTINTVGLQRAGVSEDSRRELKQLFRILYRSGKNVRMALAELDVKTLGAEAKHLVDFYASSKRGVAGYSSYRRHSDDD